ncbi:protein Dok-7 isoform X4 [Poecilia latipinna]|uniref:protein Dok-7 isoform X4 n=1 Tax=Poecilia latipinna TaxID=48699 RepID=UPI00072D9A74|nr:PREDICTED: protein Dok-7 isoform X4 [Poecilia latipinna]
MTDSVVVEGYARLRDGKKWRTRWLVFRKPSPVADCLVLVVFKDKSDKLQSNKERASVTLEEICGLEAGQWYEGVAFTLTVLCLNQVALLGFDSREALQAWELRLRYGLGEVHRFGVGVLPGTKLESGPATLHLCNNLLALVRDFPPVIIGHWNLPDLRRYGPVPNGFVFEGGTRCGYWAGVFLLASAEGEQISFLFDCIVRGICPSRGPFGLRPVLPELNSGQTNSEEKLNLETQELEKRLSMLSHGSSTVSSTCFPSAGGDDRSISGSSDASDTSQSDCSIGSRLTIWTEPASNATGSACHAGAKAALQTAEKLSAGQEGGGRPSAKPPRQLQDIGRQSSSDSGIATGSHSSYSGSFSSYTGSLDIAPGEDFGSVFSLPPQLAQELSPCSCPTALGQEYQVPTSLVGHLYDSPRRVLHEASGGDKDCEPFKSPEDHPVPSDCPAESDLGGAGGAATAEVQSEATDGQSDPAHAQGPSSDSGKTKALPSSGSSHSCGSLSASKTVVAVCSVCGGFKGNPYIQMSSSGIPTLPEKKLDGKEERRRADPAYEVMESRMPEKHPEVEEKSKYELMGSYGQQRLLQEAEGAAFVFPPEAALPERPRSESVTYVNIPVSPTSKKQLNYMELELQEPGHSARGTVAHLPSQRKSSTRYAQIDITATEMAHRVGAQHALGRQEGLHSLELRRKGTPH